jgi:ATP-dependent helicase/DNAse subunit B
LAQVRRGDTCLLTPTATMAEHLRHRMAREGHVVRPDSILTLSRFVEPFIRDTPAATRAEIDRAVARRLEESAPEAFAAIRHARGLRRTLVSLMEEAASAGATPPDIADVADTPAAQGFDALYGYVANHLTLRAARLDAAARRIASARLPFEHFFLHGFYSFTPAEVRIIGALKRVTLTLPDWAGSRETQDTLELQPLRRFVYDEPPVQPERILFRTAGQHQEAEEIARRIVRLSAEGHRFREIGVLVRSERPYVPLLASTFARFGIPAHFYFQQTLDQQPLVRYYQSLLDAVESGWDYEALLRALNMRLSGAGGTTGGDELDFELRRKLPASGLPEQLIAWQTFEHWRAARLTPAQWMDELRKLKGAATLPAATDGITHEQASAWRALPASLTAWDSALEQAAAIAGPGPVNLPTFREHLNEVLLSTPFDTATPRRNMVHVMDVYEARQWRLPIVFLCGLVERGFPQYHSEHPILNDAQRMKLRRAGIVLRTSAERQREEEFLFDVATTRATDRLYLSHPTTSATGEELLPSFLLTRYLRRHPARESAVTPARPAQSWTPPAHTPFRIEDTALLKTMRRNVPSLSPTGIETFLQCPFQFFGRTTLKLAGPPESPRDRLDFLLQGDILHRTLAEAHGSPLFVDEIFSRLFHDICRANAVPESARTEKIRLELVANLKRFLESPPLAGGAVVGVERGFDLTLKPGLRLRGKIDRVVEVAQRGLVVIDFKYSTRERIRDRVKSHQRGELVQGGLYLWAAERLFKRPAAGMLYCGLRGEVAWGGWHLPMFQWDEIGESCDREELTKLTERALEATEAVAARVAAGEAAPAPADTKKCAWCEFRDACRVESAAAEQAKGASS